MLIISLFFLAAVILSDYLFLKGLECRYDLLTFDNWQISFHCEAIGMLFVTLIAILWPLAIIYSDSFLAANNIENREVFFFFLNFSILSGIMLSFAANMITMFLCYEFLTLATIPLVIHGKSKAPFAKAGLYAMILFFASLLLLLPSIAIIQYYIGQNNFTLGGIIEGAFPDFWARILFTSLVLGLAKSTLFPLHSWLPAAMVASYPVSALLHAVIVVNAGLFCIYKIIIYIFGLKYLGMIFGGQENWIMMLPAMGVIFAAMSAFNQRKIKMILAYSTISNLNLAILTAFLFTPKAIAASIMHMIAHSFSKLCLFYSCGNFYTLEKTNYSYNLKSHAYIMPFSASMFVLSSLSLIGIPPFAGFISKIYITTASITEKDIIVITVTILSSLISALYLSKIVFFLFIRQKNIENLSLKTENLPKAMIISTLTCCLLVVSFGFIQIGISKFLKFL